MSEPTGPRVLLAGASGYIGRAVAAELVRRGYRVVALVRDPAVAGNGGRPDGLRDAPGACELAVAPATDAVQLGACLARRRLDAVISCIASRSGRPDDAWRVDCEANRNLLAAAREAGASRFVLLSAICVQRPRLAFQYAKLAFEAELAASGLDFSIVRPTAFFKSLAGQVERIQQGKPMFLFGDGRLTACKPIGEADLARYLVDCLSDPAKRNRILPIGGPGPAITPLQQGELLFELAGLAPRFRRISPRIFTAAEAVLGPLGRLGPAVAAKAELARIGHYYATESMLVWDDARQRYDADATPETGSETLRSFYQRVLRDGLAGQALGAHKVF